MSRLLRRERGGYMPEEAATLKALGDALQSSRRWYDELPAGAVMHHAETTEWRTVWSVQRERDGLTSDRT